MGDNRAQVHDFIDVIFNKHEIDRAGEFFAADFVEHNPWPGMTADVKGFQEGTQALVAAVPDLRCEIDDVLEDGDKVVVRNRIVGTNSGPFMGMPATGKHIDVQGIDIVRMTGGRIAEHWGIYDAAGMMQQLGLAPAPAGAPG